MLIGNQTKNRWVTFLMLCTMIGSSSLMQAASLEEEKEGYEQQAQEKLQQSYQLQTRIDTITEQKRYLDTEVEDSVAVYKELKDELDVLEKSIDANSKRLDKVQNEYKRANTLLGKRIRDIYMHGQIGYLDVFLGSKDFQDFMTRMDLFKHIIKMDADLLQKVLDERKEIENLQHILAMDQEKQELKVQKARAAKDEMLIKQKKQRDMLDMLKNDKKMIDAQYDELMAASKKVEQMIRQSKYRGGGSSVVVSGSGKMIWPVSGPISSDFGWRVHPRTYTEKFHSGIDIAADYEDTICAAQAGVVEYSGWISGYGNTVIIDHGGGISTLYGHNQSLIVSEGQQVSQGQPIAYCGSTGISTGPHCHFEVREDGEPVNPLGYL